MPPRHAHLVVLSGPDGGRTILLDHLPVTVGRSSQCPIQLAEEFISREHFRLNAGEGGVVLEVLSAAGVAIAGHNYRKGKHILLATGDVLVLGTETEVLYVAADDDLTTTLADLQAARAAAVAARQAESPPEVAEPSEEVEREPAEPQPPEPTEAEAESLSPAAVAARQRTQRMRKIMVAIGIYLVLLVLAAVLLTIWSGNTRRGRADDVGLQMLTRDQMVRILKRPAEGLSRNSQEAERVIADARRLFSSRHINVGDAYRCIRQYMHYKAYAKRPRFEEAADQTKFDKALRELMDRLWPIYQRACLQERQGRWHAAKEGFEQVREMVPLENDPINRNVQSYLRRVYDSIRKSKRKVRRGPLG